MRSPATTETTGRNGSRHPALRGWRPCLALVLLLSALLAGCGGDDKEDPGSAVVIEIPENASKLIDRGRPVPGIPDRIEAEVGDTLVVRNHDPKTQFVAGFPIAPGQTLDIPLNRAGSYTTNCSVHEDQSIEMVVSEPSDDSARAGKDLFRSAGCAGCHTLAAADASGPVGPVLDGLGLTAFQVEQMILTGGGQMPSFEDRLDPSEIETLAQFVSEASR